LTSSTKNGNKKVSLSLYRELGLFAIFLNIFNGTNGRSYRVAGLYLKPICAKEERNDPSMGCQLRPAYSQAMQFSHFG